MPPIEERDRQHNELQRDLGRVEGKVDSILTSMQNMLLNLTRVDAERDNLKRDLDDLRHEHSGEINGIKSKLYWLSGAAAAGGLGIGGAASKILSMIFIQH